MRFAAELAFSRSAVKAELHFDPILSLRDKHVSCLIKYKNHNF